MRSLCVVFALALTLTGCGKYKMPTATATGSIENGISVKAKTGASDTDFAKNYPAQVAWVTIKSQSTDYLVVSLSAKRMGFSQNGKIFFPVMIKDNVEFNSNIFLGKDKGLYISELGTGQSDYRFYKVGTFGARNLEFTEGDTINLRFDPGFKLNANVIESKTGDAPKFEATLSVNAMPTVISHARLFSRATAE